jgi:hypothetical protein
LISSVSHLPRAKPATKDSHRVSLDLLVCVRLREGVREQGSIFSQSESALCFRAAIFVPLLGARRFPEYVAGVSVPLFESFVIALTCLVQARSLVICAPACGFSPGHLLLCSRRKFSIYVFVLDSSVFKDQ